ncbi:MAG TPA: hypothetical protein VLY23_01250 [Candidatus Acidoferrum sp.]|nr:hypothetical protein [Candidatus Acidoferrum sp.]
MKRFTRGDWRGTIGVAASVHSQGNGPRVKNRAPASTHKKVVIVPFDGQPVKGYVNSGALGQEESVDLLTPDGEHRSLRIEDVKSIYFVRELDADFELERKTFLSRPKLDGLWVRLRFRDDDAMEGIVGNDLLDLLNNGVQLTPPDLHGNTLRMFVPRSALAEMKVLGVVGVARRMPREAGGRTRAPLPAQSKLFGE